jgi:eukaryotic-like serine/threonine-protein kinase
MTTGKTIAPVLATSAPGHSTRSLPESLVSEQVQRLGVVTAVAAGLWTYGLMMDGIVRPATVIAAIPTVNVLIELVMIATAGLWFLYVRYAPHRAVVKADAGLAFFVINAIGVALLNHWTRPPGAEFVNQLSWNAAVILIAAMILPGTPGKMMVASLVAASTDPLAVWLGYLRGMEVPSAVNTMVLFMPNYACAVVAIIPSHVLQRLGQRLKQAQDLGSYRLTELLGRGGMGEVWRARHRLLARSAAIKLVRPELLGASTEAEAQNMLRRFEREAQATAALKSPHTIRVFDYGITADRTFYYVMELLDGRDLESFVREFGPLGADRALFLLDQMCHSLAEAHARGLVHRDVTPANVYVCRMGLDYDFVKVLDFGLVTRNRALSRDSSTTTTTAHHTTTGTPAFMAPEIISEDAVDQRADVYALGCVAYYMLTGQLVFEADSPMKMFLQHLQATPIPPSERTELPIPGDVEELILSCLEKDPRNRPQNAVEFLRRLRRCRSYGSWTNDAARSWWGLHLVEISEPTLVTA